MIIKELDYKKYKGKKYQAEILSAGIFLLNRGAKALTLSGLGARSLLE